MVLKTLLLWLFLCFSYSSYANTCLPDHEGLCDPSVIITEDTQVEITEEDKGTEIVTTTTTTVTTTTTTITNEDSGDILDGSNDYVSSNKEGDMDIDWGGQGSASMPSGSTCGQLGTDKCAMITGGGNSTSAMGVPNMGTTFINTVDISDLSISNGGETNYAIKVFKPDAQDSIYMHITGRNGNTNVFTGTDILSASGIDSQYQEYTGGFDFSGSLTSIIVEVGGRDINMAVGVMFDDVSVNVIYNVINTIVTQHITTIEEIYYLDIFDPTELDFVEEVFEFNDVSFDDGEINFTPIEPETEEITYETVELEIQEFEIDFEIDLPEPEIVAVEIETELELELEIEMEMELELPEPEVEETVEVAQAEEPSDEKPEETETVEETTEEAPVEAESKEEEVEKEEPKKPVKEPTKKEKVATKIVKKIDDKERYDDTAQIKTLIVMQILGDTKGFFDAQATIQDTNINQYLDKSLQDQFGVLFEQAQGQTMEDMINAQYID